jgi:hypothetical protein
MKLAEHPTVKQLLEREATDAAEDETLDAEWLRRLCESPLILRLGSDFWRRRNTSFGRCCDERFA